MRSADVCAAVLTHLRIHARASIAELTVAVYGFNDNRSKRDSVAKAVQQLELDGSIVTAMEEVRNARGRRMPARIAYLPAAAPVIGADSHPLGDPIELAKLAPNAPLILDDHGRAIAMNAPPTSTPRRSGSRRAVSRAAAPAASYTRRVTTVQALRLR